MTNEMYNYYSGIKVDITGKEMKSIPPDRFDFIEKLAYADVQAEKKLRPESEFKTNAEYKTYLLNMLDFAQKSKAGITPTLGE